MLVFRSAVADWNTCAIGFYAADYRRGRRILVNKMAYDLRVPLPISP